MPDTNGVLETQYPHTDMASRIWMLVAFVCVVTGVAGLLLYAASDPAEEPSAGPLDTPRLIVREAEVPEGERKADGPVRVHTIEYVHGSASNVVVKTEVYSREIDPALRATGQEYLEVLDAQLSPRRGVVLFRQDLTVFVGIFDPGQRARVCLMTTWGAPFEAESARLVEDAQGLRAEVLRKSHGRTDVYEIVVTDGRPACRKLPQPE